jgi:hypothetical protein
VAAPKDMVVTVRVADAEHIATARKLLAGEALLKPFVLGLTHWKLISGLPLQNRQWVERMF